LDAEFALDRDGCVLHVLFERKSGDKLINFQHLLVFAKCIFISTIPPLPVATACNFSSSSIDCCCPASATR
jgi:hypothetical protein